MNLPGARDILIGVAWCCICAAFIETFPPNDSINFAFYVSVVVVAFVLGAMALLYEFGAPLFASESTFFVEIGWSEGNGPRDGGIWLVQNGLRIHIPWACELTLTNLRSVPMMVESYWVERKNKDDKWELESPPLGMENAKIFYGDDVPDNAFESTRPTLDDALQDKNIGPNETVQGWIFVTQWPPTPLRISLKDTTGDIFSSIAKIDGSKGWPLQRMNVNIVHKRIDISEIPIFTPPSSSIPDK